MFAGKELRFSFEHFHRFAVHIAHKFVNKRYGNLFYLTNWIGKFSNENIAGGINLAFGFCIEHWVPKTEISDHCNISSTKLLTIQHVVFYIIGNLRTVLLLDRLKISSIKTRIIIQILKLPIINDFTRYWIADVRLEEMF
jgi:hypothetical protein